MQSPFLKRLQSLGIKPQITVSMTNDMTEFVNAAGLNIGPEDIPDYFDIIDQATKCAQQCQRCSGLADCKLEPAGMQYVLELSQTGKISPSYRMCKHSVADRNARRIARLLASSRLPEFFKDKTFENFKRQENGEAYMAAQRAANDIGGQGVMLYGKPGTGKTHLAAAIVNARLAKGGQAVFVTVPELLADIRETIGRKEDSSELLELVKDIDLLVMDDMGAERLTDWVAEQMFSVINARLMRKKQTVVTTNYAPSDLITRMAIKDRSGNILDDLPGKRIVSRLTEMCQKVEMQGKDQRLVSA